jgi:hypothetical protein
MYPGKQGGHSVDHGTAGKGLSWGGIAVLSLLIALAMPSSHAYASGGANIASAPTIVFGQHTFGNTATGEWDCGPAEFWNLALKAGDQATIDWEASSGDYAHAAVIFPSGTTDFSINNVRYLSYYELGENNHGEAVFSTGAAGSYPLIFAANGCDEDHHEGPYDFTATVQHSLVATLRQYAHIRTTTVISATANLADGTAVPDGLIFTLTVTWPEGGTASYSAAISGGRLSFPLALPDTAKGKKATLIVTRGADAQFLAAESAKLEVNVGRGSPPPSACELATRHAHALKRQYMRLRVQAARAHGVPRRRIRRHLRRIHRALRSARSEAASACATA